MLDKKRQAENLIEKVENIHPETFCEEASLVTEQGVLTDNKYGLDVRYPLAQTLLILMVNRLIFGNSEYGGLAYFGSVAGGFQAQQPPSGFAAPLADSPPQPESCMF